MLRKFEPHPEVAILGAGFGGAGFGGENSFPAILWKPRML